MLLVAISVLINVLETILITYSANGCDDINDSPCCIYMNVELFVI